MNSKISEQWTRISNLIFSVSHSLFVVDFSSENIYFDETSFILARTSERKRRNDTTFAFRWHMKRCETKKVIDVWNNVKRCVMFMSKWNLNQFRIETIWIRIWSIFICQKKKKIDKERHELKPNVCEFQRHADDHQSQLSSLNSYRLNGSLSGPDLLLLRLLLSFSFVLKFCLSELVIFSDIFFRCSSIDLFLSSKGDYVLGCNPQTKNEKVIKRRLRLQANWAVDFFRHLRRSDEFVLLLFCRSLSLKMSCHEAFLSPFLVLIAVRTNSVQPGVTLPTNYIIFHVNWFADFWFVCVCICQCVDAFTIRFFFFRSISFLHLPKRYFVMQSIRKYNEPVKAIFCGTKICKHFEFSESICGTSTSSSSSSSPTFCFACVSCWATGVCLTLRRLKILKNHFSLSLSLWLFATTASEIINLNWAIKWLIKRL